MKRWRCPERPRRLALTLALGLGAGLGGARAATCDLPEQLLSVSVNGSSRGVQVLRLRQDDAGEVQVLLPEDLLRPSEQALLGERLTCDGQPLFAPAPGVRVRFNPGEQQLSLSLPARQLGGHDLDLDRLRAQSELPAQPSWGVAFGGNLNTEAPQWNGFSVRAAQAYLGVGGVTRQFSVYGDMFVGRDSQGAWRSEPRAVLRYALGPGAVVSAVWNADPGLNTPEFNETDFRGLSIEGQAGFRRRAPEWVLDLPLDAEVTVLLDGVPVTTRSVSAGSLNIRNVWIDKVGTHTLKAVISDDNGVRDEVLDLTQETFGLPRGALVYAARAGTQRGQWLVSGRAAYGLSRNVTVQGSASLTPDLQTANFGVEYSQGTWNTDLGLQYRRSSVLGSQLNVLGRVRFDRGNWQLGGLVVVPTQSFADGSLSLNAIYHVRDWFVNTSYTQGFSGNQWALAANVNHTFNNRLSGAISGGVGSGGWQVGVQLGYLVNPRLQTSAGAIAGSAGLGGALNVLYTPSPAHTFGVEVATPFGAALRYRYTRAVEAQFDVRTDGSAQAYARGAVNFSGGLVRLQPALAQRAILIRTGVPNLQLLVNGQQQVVTDGAGDALIANLPGGQLVEIAVNLNVLPLTVSVQVERERLMPPLLGLSTLDWRQNFKVSRWVQFSWEDGKLAAGADFVSSQGTFPLDDEGNSLLPASAAPIAGTLRSQDGQRSCLVRVAAGAEKASCQPAP